MPYKENSTETTAAKLLFLDEEPLVVAAIKLILPSNINRNSNSKGDRCDYLFIDSGEMLCGSSDRAALSPLLSLSANQSDIIRDCSQNRNRNRNIRRSSKFHTGVVSLKHSKVVAMEDRARNLRALCACWIEEDNT